jgi:hypothetical protein
MPISTTPTEVVGGRPTAIMVGMPTKPTSIAAGADPVTIPTRVAAANMPRATQ